MEVKICTFYLHFFGKKDFYIARKSNIADVEIAFIGLFFILSNPVEFPCQPSLPTPVSLSVIPTKLASLAINVYFYCCQFVVNAFGFDLHHWFEHTPVVHSWQWSLSLYYFCQTYLALDTHHQFWMHDYIFIYF